jgi:hypothetical protein
MVSGAHRFTAMKPAYAPAAGPWQRLHPREARSLLGHLATPWWVAGGWALDLFLGHQARPHKDLDIGILRRDARSVLDALAGWEFFEATGGELFGPVAAEVRPEVNSLWGRRLHTREWALELLLDDCEGEEWVYRRDRRVRRPLDTVMRHDAERTPYLAPELQLLYKSSRMRPEDQLDFERVRAALADDPREWLARVLGELDRQHPWLPALQAISGSPPG